MRKLKMSLAGLSPANLVLKASTLVEKMTGNPNFPTPTPDLAVVTAAREELITAIQQSQFGDKRAINNRNVKYAALAAHLRTLAAYVSLVAEGSADIILSSGFDVTRHASPLPPVGVPVALKAVRYKSGEVKLTWKAVHGNKAYMIEMTTTDPIDPGAEYNIIGYTSQVQFNVTNLTPGIYYWFRVKSLGARSESDYSDPAVIMAA